MTQKQLTEIIRSKIQAGFYPPGVLLPSERTMAEALGASRPTLRKAMEPLVKEGILEQQPGRGMLVPEESARVPWRMIALLLPDFTNRFFAEVAEAIEYAAFQRGYQIILCNSRHQPHLIEHHLKQLAARKVDGVILAHQPNQEIPKSLELLRQARIPAVLLFSSSRNADWDSVVLEDQAGVEQALRYLVSLGHRQIAYCPPLDEQSAHPRDDHYREFLRRSLPGKKPCAFHVVGRSDEQVTAALRALLADPDAPTACFAGNDHVAVRILKCLAALKVKVPAEFSVVGFDNLRLVEHLPVPLTTVDQPKQEMGRRAAELLFERLELGPDTPARREVFSPHLVIRESASLARTFPPAGAAESLAQPAPGAKAKRPQW
ncbi:MAG: GntR family transcriptional regulator [Acidobacteriaceae bacterium]|nr:GntR family transcriptional regulator [Acidobacteriaceae bacterium]